MSGYIERLKDAALPPYDHAAVEKVYQKALAADHTKIIALDDDPTGVQTVHDVFVYTDWSADTMCSLFEDGQKVSFILTNSRGLTRQDTVRIHREIARAIVQAAQGRPYAVVSRSDSTLRGHYPLETDTLRQELEAQEGVAFDGEIIMPFFEEGGRYTVGDIHYVASGERLIPAGETEFARDKTFGYRSSNLRQWIEEKTEGAYRAEEVASVSLEELRALDLRGIEEKLLALRGFQKLIVNAVCEDDVKVFVTALFSALSKGKRFLYRSAAALVKVMGGVPSRPLLTREELLDAQNRNGGLVIAGSHVHKTTAQLEALKGKTGIVCIELNQHLVVDEAALTREVDRVIAAAEETIRSGQTAVVYTRRERFDAGTGNREDELRLAVRISDAVTAVAAGLKARPNFIIAKGGITSSEIGTKALRCRKARVMGQILKGIPVWETGPESLFPAMPYVIFPGNVGDENALYDAVQKIRP